jgi:glucose-6-phosphate 1-dehydrogenase
MLPPLRPTTLVLFGVGGDLSRNNLLPALCAIASSDAAPAHLHVIGTSRRQLRADELLPKDAPSALREHFEVLTIDPDSLPDYARLQQHIATIESAIGGPCQRLFYLSVPPLAAATIIRLLGESGLSRVPGTRLLIEKPFGTDLASATQLAEDIAAHFDEPDVFRIDHYLAKEMAQQLIMLRGTNALFAPTWNAEHIASIDILASESKGVEGRADFYEQTGALRDFVQSHLLQLATLTLMEVPMRDGEVDWSAVPQARLAALRQLVPPTDVMGTVIRGQYRGYGEQVGNPSSKVETFVSLRLASSDPRWHGVPVTLTTGKALDRKRTEIRVAYRDGGELVVRVHPDEGVTLRVLAKTPGYERTAQPHALDLALAAKDMRIPDAYEQVFVDAMHGDHAVFSTNDEVLAAWHVLMPVLVAWAKRSDDLRTYEPGSTPDALMDLG